MGKQNPRAKVPQSADVRRYWAIVAELWVAATILAFLIIRIFGSGFFQNIARSMAGR